MQGSVPHTSCKVHRETTTTQTAVGVWEAHQYQSDPEDYLIWTKKSELKKPETNKNENNLFNPK